MTYHWEAQVEGTTAWWCIDDPHSTLGAALGVIDKYAVLPENQGHLRVQQVIDLPGHSSRYIAMEA